MLLLPLFRLVPLLLSIYIGSCFCSFGNVWLSFLGLSLRVGVFRFVGQYGYRIAFACASVRFSCKGSFCFLFGYKLLLVPLSCTALLLWFCPCLDLGLRLARKQLSKQSGVQSKQSRQAMQPSQPSKAHKPGKPRKGKQSKQASKPAKKGTNQSAKYDIGRRGQTREPNHYRIKISGWHGAGPN